jgi:hypothetical protein
MAFQKPMLGLALEDSDTTDVMKHCGLPVVRPDDSEGIATVMRGLLQQWESGTWGLSPSSLEAIEGYHVDHQAAVVSEVMHRLVRKRIPSANTLV